MLSMSMKEFWIILQEQETDGVITDVRVEREGRMEPSALLTCSRFQTS